MVQYSKQSLSIAINRKSKIPFKHPKAKNSSHATIATIAKIAPGDSKIQEKKRDGDHTARTQECRAPKLTPTPNSGISA
jgi:hypothetical protein